MVDRQSLTSPKPLMAVDLDGTYINCNSLRVYLSCGLRYALSHFRIAGFTKAAALMSLRMLRLISHKRMKWGCINAIGIEPNLIKRVGNILRNHIDTRVQSLVDDWIGEGGIVLLATAAPDFYIREIWPHDFVATNVKESPSNECRGEQKLGRVLDYATMNNCKLQAVVTDHYDDLPLLRYNKSGKNIIVSKNGLSSFLG